MTSSAALYEQAASCYERAGFPGRAASCLEAARLPAAAALLFERAGDLRSAARCHRRAGQLHDAERCYLALELPEEAAACWEETGNRLQAAFILAIWSRRTAHARWLACEAALSGADGSGGGLRQSQLRAIIALCDARISHDSAPLARELQLLERLLPQLLPKDRVRCEAFAVDLADAAGRHDLAAQMLAASHRAGTPGAMARWRAWANKILGGTTGIPFPSVVVAPGAD